MALVNSCCGLRLLLASVSCSKFEQLILLDLWLLLMRILLLLYTTAAVPQTSYLPSRRHVTDAVNSTGIILLGLFRIHEQGHVMI